jgi:hypothetical protein
MAQTSLDLDGRVKGSKDTPTKSDKPVEPKSGAEIFGAPDEKPACTCEKVGLEDNVDVCLEYMAPKTDCPEDVRRKRNCPFAPTEEPAQTGERDAATPTDESTTAPAKKARKKKEPAKPDSP